jgi:hypothetical protein
MTRVSLFVWLLPLDLSGMGVTTSSYATAGIALRVSGTHHDKVGNIRLVFIIIIITILVVITKIMDRNM